MSSSAAAVGGAPFGAADDRVYRAVAAGGSVEEVRRAIESSRLPAAINHVDHRYGETPLRAATRMWRGDLVFLLLENSAEGAGDGDWFEAVHWCVQENDQTGLRRLIERGVSFDIFNNAGWTPLTDACYYSHRAGNRRDLTLEIFRRSSAETRRALSQDGWSAVDYFVLGQDFLPFRPWHGELMSELLAEGISVRPYFATRAVPRLAAQAARREAELVAFQSMAHDWRAQENFVRLSLDVGELRWAEQEMLEKRARLAMLELELGSETDSDSSSESESESEKDNDSDSSEGESESEEDEGLRSGGGGGE